MNTNSKPSWSCAEDFLDSETGIVVRVNRSNHMPRNRFSIQIGRIVLDKDTKAEKFLTFLPVFVTSEHAKVSKVDSPTDALVTLLGKANAYIWSRSQEQEDALISARIEREKRGEFKEKRPMGIKSLGKADKLKREFGVGRGDE